MNPERSRETYREIGEELAAWGKVVLLETRGRVTGRPAVAAVGFVDRPDGSLVVAAGEPDTHWALNLEHDPRCRVTRDGRVMTCVAEQLEGDRRSAAVVDLILRYGTPAEGLGRGPAFALHPADGADGGSDPADGDDAPFGTGRSSQALS